MKAEVIKQKKNPFLEREEITLKITSETTPTFDEVKSAVGKNTELTIVKKINTNFGRQTFLIETVVYDNIKAKEKIETVPQKIRKKLEADKKAKEEADRKAKEEAEKKAKEEAEKKTEENTEEESSTEEIKTEEKTE